MDDDLLESCGKLINSKTYVQQGSDARNIRKKYLRILLEQRRLLDEPLDELTIRLILEEMAAMDSNNFPDNCGVGEREGRIFCSIVAQRHFYLAHGIGRSGSLTDVQPKAAGSSILLKLTNALVLNTIRDICGIKATKSCFVLPMATGMALALCLLTIRHERKAAQFVIWPRIDQKSAFKCINTAGFEPLVVEGILQGDQIVTNIGVIEEVIKKHGPDSIACVLSTTSCFAPRVFDSLPEIGEICRKFNIPHIVNNAYGLQSTKACHLIEQTIRSNGRIDAFVQSTDKNFMVPVGGAIIAGFDEAFIQKIADNYPGRASAVPCIDLFITLLSMGKNQLAELLKQRKHLFQVLNQKLTTLSEKHNLRLLYTPGNNISIAVAFPEFNDEMDKREITAIGSKLFLRCVSGCRVIACKTRQTHCAHEFIGWGSHHSQYPCNYFTAAAAIGMTEHDIDSFIARLDKLLTEEAKTAKNCTN